jgi:hypothetical protein
MFRNALPLATVLWFDLYERVVPYEDQLRWIGRELHQSYAEIESWPRSRRLETLEWVMRRWAEDTIYANPQSFVSEERTLEEVVNEMLPWDHLNSWRPKRDGDT